MREEVRAGPAALAFFTTELTEEKRRATEYYNSWGLTQRATQYFAWRAEFPQEVVPPWPSGRSPCAPW
jgi:hypothetical protein